MGVYAMDANDCARIPDKTYDAVGVVKEETTYERPKEVPEETSSETSEEEDVFVFETTS
jgi:hypothetical protein